MRIHALLFFVILPLAGCASLQNKNTQHHEAALGQSRSLIMRELGPQSGYYMNGFHVFKDSVGNEVQAHFEGGKTDALFYYTFDRKISESWLSSTLALNSKGAPWILEASSKSGRRVYRTSDGKHHAFLSKGNQLLVDTDAFFRKSLHRPGQTILIDDLPECVFAPDHDSVRIGMDEATITREYGQPVGVTRDGSRRYSDGYQDILVDFKDGRCAAIIYYADGHARLNDTWISVLLNYNSQGSVWIVAEKSTPHLTICWTPRENLLAQMSRRKSLLVYTKAYGREWLGKSAPTRGESPYFPATITPSASLWIGQKESAMTKKCGRPTLEKETRIYNDHGVLVRATFDHGICSKIIYKARKGKKFTPHWISATLALNSRGYAWFVYEGSTDRKSFYQSLDVKLNARLKNGNELGILTKQAIRKAIMTNKNGKKSP